MVKNARQEMKSERDIDFIKTATILVSLTIIFTSSIVYSFSGNTNHNSAWPLVAGGQEQEEQNQQDNSFLKRILLSIIRTVQNCLCQIYFLKWKNQ